MAESNDQETERRAYFLAKATARKRRQRQLEAERGVCEDTKRRRRDDCARELTSLQEESPQRRYNIAALHAT